MQNKIQSLKREVTKTEETKHASSSSSSSSRSSRGSPGGLSSEDTESMVGSLKKRVNTLETDLKRRQETYLAREMTDTQRIGLLENQLEKATSSRKSWMKEDKRVSLLKNMHSKIMKNIDHVQGTTARILQEQERDLLRAFRARLFDVQAELEKERSNKDDGSAALIEKNRQYEKDLDWAKEMADRLERVNQAMGKENTRLKSQFKTQQDDREFLIKELVTVRKDNERMRQEVGRLRTSLQEKDQEIKQKDAKNSRMSSLSTPVLPPAKKAGGGVVVSCFFPLSFSSFLTLSLIISLHFLLSSLFCFFYYAFLYSFHATQRPASAANPGEKAKYKTIIQRMKVLLERERKNLQRARKSYEKEVNQRTELEIFLRQCVRDVQIEIGRRREELIGTNPINMNGDQEDARRTTEDGDEVPLSEFSSADRERVMELLLSQERVVSLLYTRTFPVSGAHRGGAVTKEIQDIANR